MECDVLVIGSGAGGLSAAVVAAAHGLDVVVAEKADVFGGTTAWSGGWLWIPRNPLAVRAGIVEDTEAPRTYLRHELGNRFDTAKVDAFLDAGPRMVAFFEGSTAVRFEAGNTIPDFHGDTPGAALGGRSVVAAPFDGRRLGTWIDRLRRPIPETTLFGMGIASGADLAHFLNARRSVASALHVGRRLARHVHDLVRHRRGMRLVNGQALVGRLLRSALDAGVSLRSGLAARELLLGPHGAGGAVLSHPSGVVTITARRAVVLACGGFPHDALRQAGLFPHVARGGAHHSAAPPANTGDGLRLAEAAGGQVDGRQVDAGAWAPVSLVPRRGEAPARFPHLVERGKPGLVAVVRSGRRFANEAGSYHDLMRGLFAAIPDGEPVEAWLVCDRRFQRRYGLGAAKPFPFPLGPHLRSGYLRRGRTIAGLASACGIDRDGLVASVRRHNLAAARGEDPEFGRGGTPYQRMQGDPANRPNPCVRPIEHAPFYAVRIVPGSLGTFAGIVTDASARVLDRDGRPVRGLYAVGNDMSSMMGGHYPSGGITLGPAMTFGWLAANHIAAAAGRTARNGMDDHGGRDAA